MSGAERERYFGKLVQDRAKADKLAEVVDYDFVREVIAARIAQGHVELQETLCDAVLERMLAGVATRSFERVADPIGAEQRRAARSTSRGMVRVHRCT
mgnify:CR=1 FL=1